jgi:cytochrome c5
VSSKRHVLTAALLIATPVLLHAASQDDPSTAKPPMKATAAARPAQQYVDQGDRIFQQQCSRCHNAPEGFSPRISGTIIRHMRVRASLSKQEEEELLRFLNP